MFADRKDAGRHLAAALMDQLADQLTEATANVSGRPSDQEPQPPVVIGLARGGVPVAGEVADALHAPLDVLVVRKISLPQLPEFAIGALAEGGVRVLDPGALRALHVSPEDVAELTAREYDELRRRVERLRGDRPPLPVDGRMAIVVDDGLATGLTARAAVQALRHRGAERVVVAVPVAAPSSVRGLRQVADDVVSVLLPASLGAVSQFYYDFSQVPEPEVERLLSIHQ